MLHLILSSALAAEVSCAQVVELAEVGVPSAEILAALGNLDLSEQEARCIAEDTSLPAKLRVWADDQLPEDRPPEPEPEPTGPARAEVDCAEVVSLAGMGLPTSAVLDAVEGLWITEDTVACLQAAELSEELISWASQRITEQEQEQEQERKAAERAARVQAEQDAQPAPEIDPLIQAQRDRDRARASSLGPAAMSACLEQGPSPGQAMVLSGFLGFGAGHYAAGNTRRGVTYSVLQVAGTVTAVASLLGTQEAILGADDPVRTAEVGVAVFGIAMGAIVAIRITDTVTAGASAREARRELFEACSR